MKHYTSYEFDVCINGTKVKEYHHPDENVYIEGRRGSEFTLKFKNKSNEKVLVVLSVDGLSVMDGKPASGKAGGYLCEPFDTIDVPGWRLNKDKVAKFQFQPQGDRDNKTYVEELASEGFDVDPANQGVIGVMVFKQIPPDYPAYLAPVNNVHHYHHYNGGWWGNGDCRVYLNNSPSYGYAGDGFVPASNMNASAMGMNSISITASSAHSAPNSAPSLGTAFGDEEKFKTSQVEFKRQATPCWTGAIFYDTRSNLQKKGIVFTETTVRTPNPFPANEGCYIPKSHR